MANELTISNEFAYDDGVVDEINRSLSNLSVTVSTPRFVHNQVSVGTSEEAIPLGEVVTLGWAWFKNLDATNYVEIRTGTGSTKMAKLKAGEAALFRFGSGVTAPYIIADTAACRVEYVIFSD